MSGVLAQLRDIAPIRALAVTESLELAELQADLLLALSGFTAPPVRESVIADLPRIEVERMTPSPVSGAAQWSRGRWLILLKGSEPDSRQRFTLAHEFKHIIDHPFIDVLYPSTCTMTREQRGEQVCDYFAACLLMPRRWLIQASEEGGVHPQRLARRFGVSHTAMNKRLAALGFDRHGQLYRTKRKEVTDAKTQPAPKRCDRRTVATR
jgi:Zn-dependent peptidase ImmA (M78 family)